MNRATVTPPTPVERLERGPVRGCRNWPAMMAEYAKGNVRVTRRPPPEFWTYELSDVGRRRMRAYRGVFA